MPRQQQLALLGAHLLGAARAQDWTALQAADRTLAQELPRLADQGAWSAAELKALRRLDQAHALARQLCEDASQSLEQHIARLQTDRDGWLAYAVQDSAATPYQTPATQEARP